MNEQEMTMEMTNPVETIEQEPDFDIVLPSDDAVANEPVDDPCAPKCIELQFAPGTHIEPPTMLENAASVALGIVGGAVVVGVGRAAVKYGGKACKWVGRGVKQLWNNAFGKKETKPKKEAKSNKPTDAIDAEVVTEMPEVPAVPDEDPVD